MGKLLPVTFVWGIKSVPPVRKIRRRISLWLLLWMAAMLAPLVWNVCRRVPPQTWHLTLFLAAGCGPLIAVAPAYAMAMRGLRRAWRRSGGRLCPHCAYDVSSLECNKGLCPECGGAFNIAADAALWADSGFVVVRRRRGDGGG